MTVLTLNDACARALGGLNAGRRVPAFLPGAAHVGVERAERQSGHRSVYQPVRRGSLEAGSFEERFFLVPEAGQTDRLLRIARQALDAGRRLRRAERAGERSLSASERLMTTLTAGALRVYEELLALARLNRGRVFPSYDHLAHATGLGRATVARGLAILENIGFLKRQRRFRRIERTSVTEEAGGRGGTRYAQTSNVYRPELPKGVLAHLPRWLRPAPPPADVEHRIAQERTQTRQMLTGLSCRDFAQATVDGPLGKILARLGAALDRQGCESHEETQSQPHVFI